MTRLILIAAAIFCGFSPRAHGQMTFQPEEPRWGEEITLELRDTVESELRFDQEIFANLQVFLEDGSTVSACVPFEREKDRWEARYSAPENAKFIRALPVTRQSVGTEMRTSIALYRPDGQAARGATLMKKFQLGIRQTDSLVKEELRIYPDNHYAYFDRWLVAQAMRKKNLNERIEADLNQLQGKEKTAAWYYAMVMGRMMQGREKESANHILELFNTHPNSPVILEAYNGYNYQAFRQQIKGEGPDKVKRAMLENIEARPEFKFWRDISIMYLLTQNDEFPLASLETILQSWLEAEPGNPIPHHFLAKGYLAQDAEYLSGLKHAQAAVNGFLKGENRFFSDPQNAYGKRFLPESCRIGAALAEKAEAFGSALSLAQLGQELQTEFNESLYLLEGRLWDTLGRYDRAEEPLLTAWKKGSDKAEIRLQSIYAKQNGDSTGFTAYLRQQSTAQKGEEAPAFKATTLSGEEISLKDLRGKIVVLNFWYIGCAPCEVEIPSLNKLVEKYGEKEEVVFLAFALNDAKTLDSYLEKKPFKYQIIPRSHQIAKQYGVEGYPTHYIINRQGEMVRKMVGGNDTRHADIEPIIERLLKI